MSIPRAAARLMSNGARTSAAFSQLHIAGRLTTLPGRNQAHEHLHRQLEELRERAQAQQAVVARMQEQLRRAGMLQRNLLPSSLPTMDAADLHLFYRPAGELSGDSYDVTDLGDGRVSIALADATDHGPPAALLATYVQRALRGVEHWGKARRAMAPHEVLERVNQTLVDTQLGDCQFVAAIYAVYDPASGRVCWARGGAPYPILVRRDERPRQLVSEGPVLGAVAGAQFETAEVRLEPGDLLLLHTDGLESLVQEAPGEKPFVQLTQTPWFSSLGRQYLSLEFNELNRRASRLGEDHPLLDDCTVIALEARDAAAAAETPAGVAMQAVA